MTPWAYIPTLYLLQGFPFVLVTVVSGVVFKTLGVNNTHIAFWTSFVQLPWILKPLWSPWVEHFGSTRQWTWAMQLLSALLLSAFACCLLSPHPFVSGIIVLHLMALTAATHDIAVDGYYIHALSTEEQALFVGIRNTAFRLAMVLGQGGLILLAAQLHFLFGTALGWALSFFCLATLLLCLSLWHKQILPHPPSDQPVKETAPRQAFLHFFKRPQITSILAFLLLYRLGEAQLAKMSIPFLLDPLEKGGLALSTQQVGWLSGVFGVSALLSGGLLGGFCLSRWGLQRCLIPLWAVLNIPNFLYVLLAYRQIVPSWVVGIFLGLEQFGYGLGFSAYMLYMVRLAAGSPWKAGHYAICTSFMAMGVMLPGMCSGWIQEQIGYPLFFTWVLLCGLPGLWASLRIPLNEEELRCQIPAVI